MKARILTSAAVALVLLVSPALAANANDASSSGVTFYKDVLPISSSASGKRRSPTSSCAAMRSG